MKNWQPKVFGLLLALPTLLHTMGIGIGHVGGGDWLDFTQVIAAAGIGFVTKQHNVTGGIIQQ